MLLSHCCSAIVPLSWGISHLSNQFHGSSECYPQLPTNHPVLSLSCAHPFFSLTDLSTNPVFCADFCCIFFQRLSLMKTSTNYVEKWSALLFILTDIHFLYIRKEEEIDFFVTFFYICKSYVFFLYLSFWIVLRHFLSSVAEKLLYFFLFFIRDLLVPCGVCWHNTRGKFEQRSFYKSQSGTVWKWKGCRCVGALMQCTSDVSTISWEINASDHHLLSRNGEGVEMKCQPLNVPAYCLLSRSCSSSVFVGGGDRKERGDRAGAGGEAGRQGVPIRVRSRGKRGGSREKVHVRALL